MEHQVTLIQSGSWKADITEQEGKIVTSEPYSRSTELTVEAKCSCGEEFNDAGEAYKHVVEEADI